MTGPRRGEGGRHAGPSGRGRQRHGGGPRALAVLLAIGLAGPAAAQSLEDARQALRTGAYDRAVRVYTELASRPAAAAEAHRGLVESLVRVGRYAEAEAAARKGVSAHGGEIQNALGEVLYLTGQWDAAEGAFRSAIQAGASDELTARLNLAVLQHDRGEREDALTAFDRFIDVYNRSARLGARDLVAVGRAVQYLAVRDPQLMKDALRAFDEAAAADPGAPEPRIRAGELFLVAYNSQEAKASFQAVLATDPSHPDALLGMARALEFDGSSEAMERVEKSLEVNPRHVPARVFRARLHIGLEDYETAKTEARSALDVNPSSLEALSVLAAIHFLEGDEARYQAARRQALGLNPRYADLFSSVAELSVQNRRYAEAVEQAREAVRLDSTSWRARGILGINELRLGAIDAGKAQLEIAFAGDPYNVWYKNTLDLLDTFERFEVVETDHFRIAIDRREAPLLGPYVGKLAEDAWDAMVERYDFEPPSPVRLELFPSHADFSVRTVGLAGLGALGVAFGRVVAMDSPSARPRGEFNWSSTLWHELAHVFHLGISDHRMPRWLGEGLAVYEQRRARTRWGHKVTPSFLIAYQQGRLLPVSRLNNGFVRPAYPEQVVHSYYQASLVCELIARDHGFDALVRMLRAYRDGATNEEVFRTVLRTDVEDFDEVFDDFLKERFRGPLAAFSGAARGPGPMAGGGDDVARAALRSPGDFMAQLAMGQRLFESGDYDEAATYLERAVSLFPEYAGPNNPYWFLARIHESRGDVERAIALLAELNERSEDHYEANLLEARLRESRGDLSGAAVALERALEIHPYDVADHVRLAELGDGLLDHDLAIRERRSVVALDPVDLADALYRLALAEYEGGRTDQARRTVLRALERAPNFVLAQDLLLRIRGGSEPPPGPVGGS